MAISFTNVPGANRAPTSFIEIDGSNALGVQAPDPHRVLLIGYRSAAGTATQGTVMPILSESDGDGYFGPRAQLSAMVRAFKRINKASECFAVAMDEPVGGTANTCTFAVTGTATVSGSLQVRYGDVRVSAAVTSGDAAAAVATALAAAFTADGRVGCTAAAVTGTVTLTSAHKGTFANELTVAVESKPAGLTVTATNTNNGAGAATVSTVLALLDADTRYDTIATGLNDATNMAALEADMANRWGPIEKKPGMVFAAVAGAYGALSTYGGARNSQYSVVIACGLSPTPSWTYACQSAARDAVQSDALPNQPRNGLALPQCEAPAKVDRLDFTERNLLLYKGLSTVKYDQAGNVYLDRLITTYQKNSSNVSDATYLDLGVQRTLARMYIEALTLNSKYSRHLVGSDADTLPAGTPVVTPSLLKAAYARWYKGSVDRAWCRNAESVAKSIHVEVDALDPQRMNVSIAPEIALGLVTVATKLSFRLTPSE